MLLFLHKAFPVLSHCFCEPMDPFILTQTGGYFPVDVLVGQTWPRTAVAGRSAPRTRHLHSHAPSTDDPRSFSFGTLTAAPPDPKTRNRLSPGNVRLKRKDCITASKSCRPMRRCSRFPELSQGTINFPIAGKLALENFNLHVPRQM